MEENRVVTTDSFDDIITEDAIVSSILSSLPLREAVRTSVLSPRWRHLWIYRRKLNFGPNSILDAHTLGLVYGGPTSLTDRELVRLTREKRGQFIKSVNSVVRQLRGRARVDEFQVRYFLQRSHSHHLDAWVHFALESKTRVLALHLYKPLCKEFVKSPYNFPCHLLGSSSVEELTLECCSLKPPPTFDGLSHLKILTLLCVDVIEEDLVHLLSNCYTLEYLKLMRCPRLVTLTVSHPLSRLQKLVVKDCDLLREVNINAKYLTYLYYWGFAADFIFGQYSQLTYIYMLFKTEVSEPTLDFYLNKLSSITHLQSLTCRITGVSKVPDVTRGGLNNFLLLKHLDLCWSTRVKMSTLHLETLLSAAPYLEELILVLWVPRSGEQPTESPGKLRKMLPLCPHTRLKIIEINGFYYETWHIEIALYLLKNAIELESMTIKSDRRGLDEEQKKNLSKEAPAKVKLVV